MASRTVPVSPPAIRRTAALAPAIFALQTSHEVAQGRLAEVQFLGSTAEVQFVGYRDESFQLAQLHVLTAGRRRHPGNN
jgi:hypothetical protein